MSGDTPTRRQQRAEIDRLRADFERLTEDVADSTRLLAKAADSMGAQAESIERLTRERDAQAALAEVRLGAGLEASRSAIVYRERAETAERAASVAQREVCERRARDHSPRFGGNAAVARRARAIAKSEDWGCYPEDSTTDETPAEARRLSSQGYKAGYAAFMHGDAAATPDGECGDVNDWNAGYRAAKRHHTDETGGDQ